MQHPFLSLAPEYAVLLASARIDSDREHELATSTVRVLRLARAHADEWSEVEKKTGVPRLWGMASFERESGSDYSRSPAQGDLWSSVSTHVPRGIGPYHSWGDACVAAYAIDDLDDVGARDWTWARACYEGELYNGFGPRAHGRHTGYLWSWTSVYAGGKYVADGEWDPDHRDEQCGMIPMMMALCRLDTSLALADSLSSPVLAAPISSPVGVGQGVGGGDGAQWIQERLNALGADPQLSVDGSYGRGTRRAVATFQRSRGLTPDGLAGPLTLAALRA